MKNLYVLIANGGDGSYYPVYTFSSDTIYAMQNAYDRDELDWESTPGIDGDGFHYDVLRVPENCTYESLGISEFVFKQDE